MRYVGWKTGSRCQVTGKNQWFSESDIQMLDFASSGYNVIGSQM